VVRLDNPQRQAFLVMEKILTRMAEVYELELNLAFSDYGTAVGQVQTLIHQKHYFTDAIIEHIVDPQEGTQEADIFLSWGPHAVWLDKAVARIYDQSQGE